MSSEEQQKDITNFLNIVQLYAYCKNSCELSLSWILGGHVFD